MEGARRWAGVVSLAVGMFVLITIEELPIGVLSVMAPDLGVSEGVAGLAVTVPGLLAAVVALCTPVIVRGLDRRLVLVLALLSVVASCALSVFAPTFAVLLLARLLAGVSIGLYWAVMAVVAVAQVPPAQTSRALTVAFAGAGGALVLGVPLAAWIGTHLGWRLAFGAVGALAAVVAVLLLVLLRPVRSPERVTARKMLDAARTRAVRYVLALTALVVVGQFTTYAFISPVLVERAGVPLGDLGLMLLAYGIAGLIGNFAIGPVLRRSAPLGAGVVVTGTALALAAVVLVMHTPTSAAIVMAMWGLFFGAVGVAFQAFIGAEAAGVIEEATALNSAGFNLAIALGAGLGGVILEVAGQEALLLSSLLLVTLGAGVALMYRLRGPRPHGTGAGALSH